MRKDPDVSVITLSDDDEGEGDFGDLDHSTPAPSRRKSILSVAPPDTPELPSPSVFLGKELLDSGESLPPTPLALHTSSLLFQSHGPSLSRQEAIDLPSSPPPLYESDSNDCQILDDFISAEPLERDLATSFYLSSPESTPFLHNPKTTVDYSDATELLSSSCESLSASDAEIPPVSSTSFLARPSRIMGTRRTANTAYLMSDPPSRPEVPPLAHRSLRSSPPIGSTRLAESRSKRAPSAREQKERERQFAKDLSAVNKKHMDVKDIAGDVTVIVDPQLLSLIADEQGKKSNAMQRSTSASTAPATPRTLAQRSKTASTEEEIGAQAMEDVLFTHLKEGGIQCRVEPLDTACAAVRWEIRTRRKWDASIRMYVPVSHQVRKTKAAAMVVLGSSRFLELVATKRVRRLAEIWRASMAVTRVFVVVLGLQKALRKTTTAGTREFDRQMRQLLKDGTMPASNGSLVRQEEGNSTEEAVEQAVLELQLTCRWIGWFTQCADAKALGRLLWRTTVDLALHEMTHKDAGSFGGAGGGHGQSSRCFITEEVARGLRVAAVKTGTSLKDSWALSLTQIPKVTLPVAQAIAAKYPTPQSLFTAWMVAPAAAELLLADIIVPGASSGGRRLGSAMSTRIHKVFNEPDPTRPFAEL
ncbi:hypothetical protein IW140_004231 [Coemansia sp. RSA 1813]|nr:hypothetical protein EV178_004332 [Coemansia sp. RSA 1646]KAJ1769465.1 hypothetical protein LPJ74_004013 [Coemansia sp. RSA 1843]KAJ2088084.1 hypothetical protein IW138_004504 [Coemansia sp. RSA 986]KAJ2214871.1 hypothetical protein EV179_002681 [Coemansia sp. RSA 487]KAJ2568060.1 hypothetical protein IW140_004231 [Coemansia sp. RSA 1813]